MPTRLDPNIQSDEASELEVNMLSRVVGQDRAVRQIVRTFQIFQAGFSAPHRPLSVLLLAGPTGSGKSRTVEALSESLFGGRNAVVRIDCGEFQHGHEISKLIGSPPGYLGYGDSKSRISQEILEQHWNEEHPRISIILFDEIEKAHHDLYQLLLGILDRAVLTLGDNREVDFSRTMVFLTSNLGSQEVSRLLAGGMGFSNTTPDQDGLDLKIYNTTKTAVRQKFSPEFINRLDRIIVFRSLDHEHLQDILDIELNKIRERILQSGKKLFNFVLTPDANEFLIREGTDSKSGARHLKRAIERHLVAPLSNIAVSGQLQHGDTVRVDVDGDTVIFEVDE